VDKCLVCFEPADADYHPRCAKALFETPAAPAIDIDLDALADAALTLLRAAGSVAGVQKKISADRLPERPKRLCLCALGGRFILKPPVAEYPYLVENEAFCMELSRRLGYPTAPHGLARAGNGALVYLTRRFDRPPDGTKLPQEDFCQLGQRPAADKYKGSLEAAAKALVFSGQAGLDAGRFFELNLTAWLMGNADLHLKNFSLYRPAAERWQLAPAYDLVSTALVLEEDREETALSLNGKKTRLQAGDWAAFAAKLGLGDRVSRNLVGRLLRAWPAVEALCRASFLPAAQQDSFLTRWRERAGRLEVLG
jgi:serine/threonine-protein kinase HipA